MPPSRAEGPSSPQAFLTPLVLRVRHRKWVFVIGALVQAAAVALMAVAAALGSGLSAGLTIVALLAVLSLGRCLCSISSKDVQGRTVAKGTRGRINGLATTASGLVAITLGLGIRFLGDRDVDAGRLAWLLAGGAALWVVVAVLYSGIREPAGQEQPTREPGDGQGWFARTSALLREDRDFRHFVVVRSFLLVSALSPPFVVALSVRSGTDGLAGLGGFVIASGLAALLGGRIFGRLADSSSRALMTAGAGTASAIIVVLVVIVSLPGFSGDSTAGARLPEVSRR
ncbi:MFS transporter [uncultured Arthrobacter sp.]|uniref:MFS transporter n=1 Tax=uncultured Arthrobacter sp. TaxID=114050 RepID=UPI002615F36E|nr:MFS transporter [uncultured Arthrobacter sp.]